MFLAVYAARPVYLMVNPEKRREMLLAKAGETAAPDPAGLSPLARRLREHVEFMAGKVGERSAYQTQAGVKVRGYVADRFREAGYAPEFLEYEAFRRQDFIRGKPYANVEALGPGTATSGWSAPTTTPRPAGADDRQRRGRAHRLARLMKDRSASEHRFVAFDGGASSSPRATWAVIGTPGAPGRGRQGPQGAIPRCWDTSTPGPVPSSTLPSWPCLSQDGDFVGLASNLSSSGLMRFPEVLAGALDFPIEGSCPSIFSTSPSRPAQFLVGGLRPSCSRIPRSSEPSLPPGHGYPGHAQYERMAVVTEALAGVLSR